MSAAGLSRYWSGRRLWSRWDMLSLDAKAFYEATVHLRRMRDTMNDGGNSALNLMDDARYHLRELRQHLTALGAPVTIMAVDDLEALFDDMTIDCGAISDAADDVDRQLRRELTHSVAFTIESSRQPYYDPKSPLFGADFSARFISAAFDLDEAAKCFALGRPTAAVFHLMHVMEIGIRAIARCLQVPDPTKPAEKNWKIILDHIRKDGIEKHWPTAADRMAPDAVLFESLHASLDAVRNPWRNATMHVETKYTDDEAEHIFLVVKHFMRKLASRCDENGEPKA